MSSFGDDRAFIYSDVFIPLRGFIKIARDSCTKKKELTLYFGPVLV